MENNLANRIRERLTVVGKSAASASLEAGLGRSAITDILSGNSGSPRLATLEKLVSVLDCPLTYLIGLDEDATPLSDQSRQSLDKPIIQYRPVQSISKAGVFRDKTSRTDEARGEHPAYHLYGSPNFPDWKVEGVIIGDSSLSCAHLLQGDIGTVAVPPWHRDPAKRKSIPLRDKTIVYTVREISSPVLSESSLRIVTREGDFIHLDVDTSSDPSQTRRVTINIHEVDDTVDDPNTFKIDGGTIRIVGILIRVYRDIETE